MSPARTVEISQKYAFALDFKKSGSARNRHKRAGFQGKIVFLVNGARTPSAELEVDFLKWKLNLAPSLGGAGRVVLPGNAREVAAARLGPSEAVQARGVAEVHMNVTASPSYDVGWNANAGGGSRGVSEQSDDRAHA